MSRDMLSQEEIDALLRANNLVEEEEANESLDVGEFLTPFEQDALGEIGNISFGSAATALSTLLNQKVDITTPTVSMIKTSELDKEFPMPHVAVHVQYTDGFEGINMLVIRMEDAAVIADLMMGGSGKPESTELSDLHISAVQEAMNQMMGSAATSMSTIFNQFVNISPPGINVLDLAQGKGAENFPENETLVKVSFRLKVGERGELIDSTIMQLLPLSFAKQMINMLMGTGGAEPAPQTKQQVPQQEMSAPQAAAQKEVAAAGEVAAPPPPQSPPQPPQPPAGYAPPMGYAAYPWGYQDPYAHPGMQPPGYPPPPYPPHFQQPPTAHAPQQFGGGSGNGSGTMANVRPAQFSALGGGQIGAVEEQNLNLLLDIPLQVTVELGRTKKLIKEILELSAGSIIQLDKLAGEPVDILVNNKLIAKGEVVVIDENFGVRITDIINQWDRIQKLQ
jgi:flagellar motor switch protein FliN/FliY